MKKQIRFLSILLALIVLTASFAACTKKEDEGNSSNISSVSNLGGDESSFDYSSALTDTGYWKGVTAKDFVTLFDYKSMEIPKASVEVTDNDIQTEISNYVSEYTTKEQVKDRAVENGDTINIDYVGSVDGVEFDNGSTGGMGTDVTIGVTSYIDDFLEQTIGHMPGDTFDVNVTFPTDYHETSLQGKDAVFVTTVNYISSTVVPEVTDSFVAEKFADTKGWKTVEEMKTGIKESLSKKKVSSYIENYIFNEVEVKSIPDELIKYHEEMIVDYCNFYAKYYNISVEEFLTSYMGVETMEEMIESNKESSEKESTYVLVVQAIAEELKMVATDENVKSYFADINVEDYSGYEEDYGMPYLKQAALAQMVLDYIAENAKIA